MSTLRTPDYGARAARYDELRPPGIEWRRSFEVLVREADLRGRRVLDVGCGTGTWLQALVEREAAKAWGVDPAAEMLEVARAKVPAAGLKQGSIESLPFKDGWFERAIATLVIHTVERPRGFAEVRRVLGDDGRFGIVTFDPSQLDHYYLNRLFPSFRRIDLERFVPRGVLEAELTAAGFASVATTPLFGETEIDRETALTKIRGRHISTFDLISDEEYAEGLERAERELPARITYPHRILIVVAAKG